MTATHIHNIMNGNQVQESLFFSSVHSPFLWSSAETQIINNLRLEVGIVKASQTDECVYSYYT